MKHWPWPLSCLYIPLALCVFFSEATLGASSQSELTLTTKSSHPSDGREEQKKSHGETKQAANPQTEPPRIPVTIEGPVTIINQPSANEQERKANEQSKNIWDKLWTDVVLNPTQWVNVGALVIAGVAAGFAYAAYCATRRQANAAEQTLALASTPRLHIDGVRVVGFESGQEPIFFVKIVNAGPATADDVAINIRVEPIPQYPGGKYSGGHNKMIIPANDSREYFIQIHHPLTDAIMDGFKRQDWPLRVTGYFEHGQKRTEYCYKYYPFFEPRPEGLPQFIQCDFDTRLTTLVRVEDRIQT